MPAWNPKKRWRKPAKIKDPDREAIPVDKTVLKIGLTDLDFASLASKDKKQKHEAEIKVLDLITDHSSSFYPQKERTAAVVKARAKLGIDPAHHVVLSIDGGGVRGLIPLAVLDRFEREHHVRLADFADIIIGTSTGAIIGSLIAAGQTAKQIQEFYHKELANIFIIDRGEENLYPYRDDLDEHDSLMPLDYIERKPIVDMVKIGRDRKKRLLAGSPVYNKRNIRRLLREFFAANDCTLLGDLARKNNCIVVFSAVETQTGSTIFMSATGSERFPGSNEEAITANCVESSLSAPLYFREFRGLVDGGTLTGNAPTLGALLHLEALSKRMLDPKVLVFEENPALNLMWLSEYEVQPFDAHASTIFSFGCGVRPVPPLFTDPLKQEGEPTYYGGAEYPYGEISRVTEIMESMPSFELGWENLNPIELNNDALSYFSALRDRKDDVVQLVSQLLACMKDGGRFGLGALVDVLSFLREGLAKDATVLQDRVLRSSMFRGDYRRVQLSLDEKMQTKGLWRLLGDIDFEAFAGVNPNYCISLQVFQTVKGKKKRVADYSRNLISIWKDPLFRANKLHEAGPALEPMGQGSMRWIQCIGNRFADAIGDYYRTRDGGPIPYLGADLVDDDGRDFYVSRDYFPNSKVGGGPASLGQFTDWQGESSG